jgi:hypothetical protein
MLNQTAPAARVLRRHAQDLLVLLTAGTVLLRAAREIVGFKRANDRQQAS